MYIDRWDYNHEAFKRTNFISIIKKFLHETSSLKEKPFTSPLINRIKELMDLEMLGTDEPPIQRIRDDSKEGFIVRPAFDILSRELQEVCNIG